MKGLADLVGVSWQTVQQWEREEGGTAPKRERLADVARALNTTPEILLFGYLAQGDVADNKDPVISDISHEALRVARAFDKLKGEKERNSIIALLKAFDVL
jgi:transcriptional regulator with XRE-family HTH domain